MDTPIPKWIWQNLKLTDKKSSKMPGDPVGYDWQETEEKTCDSCGDSVVDRRVTVRRHFSPVPHWRIKCEACKQYWDYDRKSFRLCPQKANYYYNTRYKDK